MQHPASQLLDYCHGTISSGKACHSPNYTERPFVLGPSVPRQLATRDGGRTRQAALRVGGAPNAAPALLLRGIPGEARTEREGECTHARSHIILTVQCHVVSAAGVINIGVLEQRRMVPGSQKAVNFLIVLEQSRRNSDPHTWAAGRRSAGECSPSEECQENEVRGEQRIAASESRAPKLQGVI